MNSDALGGAIRNPIQQEVIVGRAFSGSVCSLPYTMPVFGTGALCIPSQQLFLDSRFLDIYEKLVTRSSFQIMIPSFFHSDCRRIV